MDASFNVRDCCSDDRAIAHSSNEAQRLGGAVDPPNEFRRKKFFANATVDMHETDAMTSVGMWLSMWAVSR
jgi:hypothetical protein